MNLTVYEQLVFDLDYILFMIIYSTNEPSSWWKSRSIDWELELELH